MSAQYKKGEPGSGSRHRTAREKLRIVLEASRLGEAELGAFLRREGVLGAELDAWRAAAMSAAEAALSPAQRSPRDRSPDARRVRELERELGRKDKALAEVTALLALKKKLAAILGDEDDDTGPRNGR
jgi:hypothetical protein